MRHRAGLLVEILSLLAIAFAIALGGRAVLAELHQFATAAILMLGAGLVSLSISLRKLGRSPSRLEVTRRGAYLTGVVLAIWAVVAPARWNVGATIAMIEVAIGFDILSRLSPPGQTAAGLEDEERRTAP